MEQTPNTASALPDDAFIGIDPNDTSDLKLKGATFTARVLPVGLWDILTSKDSIIYEAAKARAIARLVEQGRDPIEKAYPDSPESTVTLLDVEATSESEFMRLRARAELEVIRFGLLNHVNVATRNGVVPFTTEHVLVEGHDIMVVAPSTLAFYEVNARLRQSLYLHILKLNTLGEREKKV